jgi:TIR domain
MGEYTYQAFFSYKRHDLTNYWHQQLHKRLEYWLSQDLGLPTANVFFDSQSIGNGLDFNSCIADALRGSAVIISITSPMYFNSPHCFSEIQAFSDREQMLNLRRGSLIACARYHDGESFPAIYRTLQAYDFTKFTSTAARFWESDKGMAFEEIIQQFAEQVAKKIKSAPPPSKDFPASFFSETPSASAEKIRRPADYVRMGYASAT